MRFKRAALLAAGLTGLRGVLALWKRRRTEDDTSLKDQVVLITGSSRGLGFLLAQEFAREGCRLVLCARDASELEHAQAQLEQQGADVIAIPCDVSDRAQVDELVQEAVASRGSIDILVNNAGIIQVGPVETMTIEDFENALGTMFWGTLYPTLAVLPDMLTRTYGRIVNVTSIGGKVSVPHLLPYNAAKFAAVGLSEGLRAELAHKGITVTTIVPGLMRTGSYLNALFNGQHENEFTWFSLGSSLPFITMNAEQAAREIVHATKQGESEYILTLPARLLALVHGVFPGVTAQVLGLVARFLLPGADRSDTVTERGMEIQEYLETPRRQLLNVLTTLGRQGARRTNQHPGPTSTIDASIGAGDSH